ncbi:MAG: DUF3576 domain-containing protein [Pseudomonadota bacterium]|nr:MAG: DUF3576 domain-containing protein [Pseudomonadota bacterium]
MEKKQKTRKSPVRYRILTLCLMLCLTLTACTEGSVKREASYPTRYDTGEDIVYSDQKRDTIWGEGSTFSDKLFGRDKQDDSGSGIGVNSFLWRASLDTVSFMPVQTADPFGGVILTDWYENPNVQGERFKVNVYILDRQLRSDGVRVAVFKQTRDNGGTWRDSAVGDKTALQLEDTILTRARELRVAQRASE